MSARPAGLGPGKTAAPIIGSAPHFELWHLAYLILGLVMSGLIPFLLPLLVVQGTHQLGAVAYVTGAYGIGLLTAPLFGVLAERRHLYRPLFAGAFAVLGFAFAAVPYVASLVPWILLALIIGIATGAASTIATLFIVDFTPKSDWEPRIGWLQSVNAVGQLAGLLLAGAFAGGQFLLGFRIAAGLALLAALLGAAKPPVGQRSKLGRDPPTGSPLQPLLRATQLEPPFGGLWQHSHHLRGAPIRGLLAALPTPFGRFLLAWSVYNFGIAAFFAYYPLIMRESYGMPPSATAMAYAIAAGIGIFLFVAAGRLAVRRGSRTVFQLGLALRFFGFTFLAFALITTLPGEMFIAPSGFLLVMLAWPVLSVSSTALAARLSSISEGAAVGLLSGCGALATVVGTFTSGPLVHAFGYGIVLPLAIAGLVTAALFTLGGDDRPAGVPPTLPATAVTSAGEHPSPGPRRT